MKLILKNRKFAILITVVVAVLATMFGVSRTSGRQTRKIEAMFYDGVYLEGEGYTQPGMSSHIRNCADAALGFATIMENHPELAQEAGKLIATQQALVDAYSLSNINSAFISMVDSYNVLMSATTRIALSEREAAAVNQYSNLFSGAQKAMESSRYNTMVTEYLDGRSALTLIISLLAPVKAPHYFDMPTLDS